MIRKAVRSDVEERRFSAASSSTTHAGFSPWILHRVGRTLLSDAFDFAVAFDSDSETQLGLGPRKRAVTRKSGASSAA